VTVTAYVTVRRERWPFCVCPGVARSGLCVGLESALREASDLAEDLIRARGPFEWRGLVVGRLDERPIAAFNCVTLVCEPRFNWRCVSKPNQRSTWLSHDAWVGVKCIWKRGRFVSHRFTAGVLWVA
jgi:hypothetical protein